MATNVLAPCVARPSVATILVILDKRDHFFLEEGFYLTVRCTLLSPEWPNSHQITMSDCILFYILGEMSESFAFGT